MHGHAAIVAGLGTGATAAAHMCKRAAVTLTNGITGERISEVFADGEEPLARAYRELLDCFGLADGVCVDVAVHLPIGAGLGSSAALGVAIARALRALSDAPQQLVAEAVSRSEAVFHGNASGVDQAAALWGGLFRFQRPDQMQALVGHKMRVLACHTGAGGSTAKLVAAVASRRAARPALVESIFDAIGEVVRSAEDALEAGDLEVLGELMDVNHSLLGALGVSTQKLDTACHVAREHGAYGAKLTGAGGGGCVFALAEPEHEDRIIDAWREHGWSTYAFDLQPPAVK